MHRPLICCAAILIGCGSDALTAGQRALEQDNYAEAVTRLRQAYEESSGGETASKAYQKALTGYHEQLQRSNASVEDCDAAVEALSAIGGFAEGTKAVQGEEEVLSQAILCAARHRARKQASDEAAQVVVKGIKRLPGFAPGSPVLAKALHEPALRAARAGQVVETTALAQVIFSSGEQGLALALVDLLEASGASPGDIYPVLEDRANRAATSDAAAGLAAGFAVYRGHAADSARWYDEIAARMSKDGSATAKNLKRYATLRGEEAAQVAAFKRGACQVLTPPPPAIKIKAAPAVSLVQAGDGALLVWVEGEKAPDQRVRLARLNADGAPGQPREVAKTMPRAAPAPAGDVLAAYAPKNREPALDVIRCGETIELAARGAPECAWARATLGDDGQVTSKLTPIGPLGEKGRMPSEDVWWNLGCANNKLVHMWLADTQLMRVAWFVDGQPEGEPSNMRLPGFAPWFVATGADDGATRLIWVDIMGEGYSQVLGIVIPENHEVPLAEDGSNAAGQPMVESIEGRVEHIRLTPVGERLALTFYPRQGDIMVRWMEKSGRLLGAASPVARLRENAQKVRYDAAAAGERLAVVWTEALTDQWAPLYFQSIGSDGNNPSRPQRVAGMVRPDLSPMITSVGDHFVVAWVDRTEEEGETLRSAALRCDQ